MIVVDAAAVVDVTLGRPSAAWVLDEMAGAPRCAPEHMLAEVASAIARFLRAGDVTAEDAAAALDDAASMTIETVPLTATHLRRALGLQDRIRVLDGLYVAVAEQRRCPLLTTDLRLARAEPPCEVLAPR